jgi:DNA-binding NtrC family response regulator
MSQDKKLCIVFLIHAETAVRDFIERILHHHGALVFSASTAASALHFLRGYNDDVHLVLVDEHLPGANGVELANSIAVQRPAARVVLMTDSAKHDALVEWRGRVLRKPLHAAALKLQVEEALGEMPCDLVPQRMRATELGQ